VGRLLTVKGGGPAAPEMGGGESHGSQALGIAGLPKLLSTAGRKVILQTRGYHLTTGFLLMETAIFKGGKKK